MYFLYLSDYIVSYYKYFADYSQQKRAIQKMKLDKQ